MSLFIAILLAAQITNATASIAPPPEVQQKVTPILDLCATKDRAQGESQNKQLFQYGQMVGALFQMKTKSSDEALVVLMNYYIGESLGDDLLHQVTARGKRMLPLLLKYRNVRVIFAQKEYPLTILLSPDVRKENFDLVISSVRAGKVIGED